ncbi:hypothetical protein TPELB_14130 [Terrisporobacter petrolearius]|uniref:HNH endonuclease n=1 Tax=Terrisporobacter petrolearius TaxID=1460447 RepID=A0ABZ3FBD0_9FIRM
MSLNFDKKHLKIAEVLVETVKEGQLINSEKIITYGKLSSIVGLPISTDEERQIFGRYLGEISSYCNENNMPLISAMVIRKPDKYNNKYNSNKIDMPGNGFYNLYKDLRGIEIKSEDEKAIVFYKELKLIKTYENWDRLIGLLEYEIKPISRIKKKKTLLLNKFNNNVEFIEVDEFIDIENIVIEEGKYTETLIKAKKRNPKARRIKIEQFKKDNNGKVFCEVCKEDDEVVLDVHHDNVEICNMEEGHLTKLSDLRVLCANCHRKVHGYKITVEELIKKS